MEVPKIMRISSDRSIRPLKIPAPVPRLPRPFSTLNDSTLIFNTRRRLLRLHFEEVEDSHFIKFPSTTSRPLMSPQKDKIPYLPEACTGSTSEQMEHRCNLELNESPSSSFLQLLQTKQLHLAQCQLKESYPHQLCLYNDNRPDLFIGHTHTGSENLSEETLESFLLNATTFNPSDKMKITQRKIIDKQPDRAKQLLALPLDSHPCIPSAFGLVVHGEEDESKKQQSESDLKCQDQSLSIMSTLNRVCEDTRRSPRRSFLQDCESLILPIHGISSSHMSSQEMRVISGRALFFLHFYTNTFKRVTIDSVLRQNSRLDAKLFELSKTLDNDKLIRILSNNRGTSSRRVVLPSTRVIKEQSESQMYEVCDLDKFLLDDQDEPNYDSDYYERLEKPVGELKLEIFLESPDNNKKVLLSYRGRSEYASVSFSDSMPEQQNSKMILDSYSSEGSAISPTFGGISQESSPSLKESSQLATSFYRGLNRIYSHLDTESSGQLYTRENTARLMYEIRNYISNNKEQLIQEENSFLEEGGADSSFQGCYSAFTYEPNCTTGVYKPEVGRNQSMRSVGKKHSKRSSCMDFKLQLLPSEEIITPKKEPHPSVIFGKSPGEKKLEREMEEIILGYTKKLRRQQEQE